MKRQGIRQLVGLALVAAVGWSVSAAATEGLYSADNLMGSPVHASDGERVGTVDDLLLGDTMAVHSLIVELDNVVRLGGREVVAERGMFTVTTTDGPSAFQDITYEVRLTVGSDELEDLPEYDEGWWNRTTSRLQQAWENTQKGTRSAWERTQELGSAAWQNLREGAESLGERIGDAVGGDEGQ